MRTSSKKYPDFFKVFLPHRSSERMKIPVAFVACLSEKLPENAILRSSRSGKDWHVTVHNFDGCFFFDDGWKQFVEGDSLEAGDILAFSYDGGKVFEFKTFDTSCCEKMTIKEEEEEEEAVAAEAEEEDEEEEDDDDDDDEEEEDDDDRDEEEEGDDDDDMDDDDYVIDQECMEEDDEEEEEEVGRETDKGGSRKASRLRNRNFASRDDAEFEHHGIEVKSYIEPENPYFLTRLKERRKNELPIPMHVIRDYDLSLPGSITIRDPLKRTSNGKVVAWNDGRVCIRGWRAVCRRNRISKHDICICEFMLAENLMQLHIISMQPGQ